MKRLKMIFGSLLMLIVMTSFSQCSGSKQLDKKAPMEIAQAYCQRWVGGIEGAGSGINLVLPAESSEIQLDSVYFRGRSAKLEFNESGNVYIGRFINESPKKKDIIVNADPKKEYGNEMPKLPEKIPFELKDTECVASYKSDDKIRYFKIENIVEKALIPYPSAPKNKQ